VSRPSLEAPAIAHLLDHTRRTVLVGLAAALTCAFAPDTAAPPAKVLGEIPRTDFLAEGVAVTPKGAILLSGVRGRTILQLSADGRVRPWLKGEAEGGLFGLATDPARDRLWAAETGGEEVPGGAGPRITGVLEIRLSDGKILSFHPAPTDGRPHWIGDVATGPDGAVYASDSVNGQVYRLRRGADRLELLTETGLKSPQGLALSADGTRLILGDYATGLHRIDLATGAVGPTLPAPRPVRGLDGLKRYGHDLIATYNGAAPNAVVRLRLNADETAITAIDALARGPDILEDVSLGAVYGDRFIFVARSGWAGFDDKGRPNGQAQRPSVVAQIALDPVSKGATP